MFICDISTVGAGVHAWHLALHVGLAGFVSLGGGIFLTLGAIAHRRARRARALVDRG
jgi:ABC-type branched-subunit amino acid transport system permease subunit